MISKKMIENNDISQLTNVFPELNEYSQNKQQIQVAFEFAQHQSPGIYRETREISAFLCAATSDPNKNTNFVPRPIVKKIKELFPNAAKIITEFNNANRCINRSLRPDGKYDFLFSGEVNSTIGIHNNELSLIKEKMKYIEDYAQYFDVNLSIDYKSIENAINVYQQADDFAKEMQKLGINGVDEQKIIDCRDEYFLQHKGMSEEQLPDQGIKLHISAKDKQDYKNLCESIIPDLVDYGATFKVMNTRLFNEFFDKDNAQAGKSITIYQTQWDAATFFDKHKELLEDKSIKVNGDKSLGGRLYGRYGSFKNNFVINPITNQKEIDDRSKAFPDFVKDISLNDYIQSCKDPTYQLSLNLPKTKDEIIKDSPDIKEPNFENAEPIQVIRAMSTVEYEEFMNSETSKQPLYEFDEEFDEDGFDLAE